MRITYRYEGGPLDGRTAYHKLIPENPDEPFLCKEVTTPGRGEVLKVPGGDLEACGLYHLEQRPLPPLPFGLPPEPPADAPDELREYMLAARAKAKEVRTQAAGTEWVAVHHKSEQDQDWAPLEQKKPEPAPEKKRKPKEEPKRLPDNHPAVLRLKPYEKAIREALDRRKDGQG